MKRFVFEDINDVATTMVAKVHNGTCAVSAICHYELATAIAEELVREGCNIDFAEIYSYEYNCYDREYAVTVHADHEENIFVSVDPLYRDDKYLFHYSDVIYVHQDCNSKLLKHVDAEELYEFAVGELDEEDTDKDEMCCDCCEECEDTDDEDDNIITHHSDSVTVSRDKFGNPTGFTKSCFMDNGDGISQYSSYSYYCNDEDILRDMARDLDIEL